MPTKWRIFLDTSALLAGLNSPTGAAGVILAACFAHEFMPVVSPQIIEEAERNIPVKFPLLKDGWASFLLIPPEVAPEPPLSEVRRARVLLPTSDAPILAQNLTRSLHGTRGTSSVQMCARKRHFLFSLRENSLKVCGAQNARPGGRDDVSSLLYNTF